MTAAELFTLAVVAGFFVSVAVWAARRRTPATPTREGRDIASWTVEPAEVLPLTQEDLDALLERTFPDPAAREAARERLALYDDNEPVRVRTAILKLSAGDLRLVEELVSDARTDYRDVLAWAEYPEELERPGAGWLTPAEAEALTQVRRRDREQYLAWLRGKKKA